MENLLRSDSYKISHGLMYPDGMNFMFDYVEARSGGKWSEVMFAGFQAFIKNYLLVPFTKDDIDYAEKMFERHFGFKLFNREPFDYILEEYNGYFPVIIKAVPEGMVVPTGNILVSVFCNDPKCASIVSFLETSILRAVWYCSSVATNSYMMKKHLIHLGKITATEADLKAWIPFALHDFGARGVSSSESAKLGGLGHLFNFMGSDTLEAVGEADKLYGIAAGCPGYSVVASEHSVMCSEGREGEFKVIERIFETYKNAPIISCVNDTYDMDAHLEYLGTAMRDRILAWGGRWVTRPDSGKPEESVVKCLESLAKNFGFTRNGKGYKVLPSCIRVIQGDGINEETLIRVLTAIAKADFCVTNVVFGSGGGLLQQVNRDTLRFAMKASYIEVDGEGREVFKQPATDTTKSSKKGQISLYQLGSGEYATLTEEEVKSYSKDGMCCDEVLVPVYFFGRLLKEYTLDEVRSNTGAW